MRWASDRALREWSELKDCEGPADLQVLELRSNQLRVEE